MLIDCFCRAAVKAAQSDHPVLGRLIARLGYKNVFLTTIDAVAQAPVWEKRKLLRPLHAMEIAEAKMLKQNVVRKLFIVLILNIAGAGLVGYPVAYPRMT